MRPTSSRRRRQQSPARRQRRRGAAAVERALAPHLRRHDHAAAGALRRALLDLGGQRLQIQDAEADAASRRSARTSSAAAARSSPTAAAKRPSTKPPPRSPPWHAERAERGDHAAEEEQFRRLKEKLDAYASEHGFAELDRDDDHRRGLVIRLLTDRVLFNSGSATLKPRGDAAPDRDLPPRQPRPQPRHLGRGQHRRRADLDLAIPQQLGAFRGPRDRRRPLHDRPRSGGPPARSERRRRRAPDRPEHDRRRARRATAGSKSPCCAAAVQKEVSRSERQGKNDLDRGRRSRRRRPRLQNGAGAEVGVESEGRRHRLRDAERIPPQPGRTAATRN